MDFFRRNMKTILWIVLIGLVFATFMSFGAGGYLTKGYDTVATVNSKKVSYTEFTKSVNRVIENQQAQKKDAQLTETDIKQIKTNVLQEMISEEAFYQIALKYGIDVTDNEIRAYLQQIPAFQKNGSFDHMTYFNALKYNLKMTPEEFENSRRRGLAVEKVRFLFFLLSKVTDKEAELKYLEKNKNLKNWAKDKDKFIETLRNEKRILLFNQWVNQLQQKIKIQEFLSKFEQREGRSQ
ncbi:MAG: SurA N-terminal domain-containing protein [Elusimicrobia bacterium]|nr:SurA N-terminal domain-containing protein [Elusimicrobiota bacterium]